MKTQKLVFKKSNLLNREQMCKIKGGGDHSIIPPVPEPDGNGE